MSFTLTNSDAASKAVPHDVQIVSVAEAGEW